MSKRKSGVSVTNTLFKYFSKTPPANKKSKPTNGDSQDCSQLDLSSSNESDVRNESNKRERQQTESPGIVQSDSEDEMILSRKYKRIRLNPIESDESDIENMADNKTSSIPEKVSVEKRLQDSFKYEASPSNKDKAKENKPVPKDILTPIKAEPVGKPAVALDDGNWLHCKLDFLKPDKIRDAQKRRPDHPDYDPSTLYVPRDFFNDQTPAHRQWWEMKSSHFDCVLFFKVGKFYELYHMDAAVGVTELGFSYMKGEFAHSGFPESAYARMASTLVSKGYKVARVEQTETPEMMKERCKKLGGHVTKWDKVVQREICQVTLRGTQVCGLQDPGPSEHGTNYMLALTEELNEEVDDEEVEVAEEEVEVEDSNKENKKLRSTKSGRQPAVNYKRRTINNGYGLAMSIDLNSSKMKGGSSYGVCFVDTSIGLFHLGEFKDDKHSSRLLTALAHFPPAVIVHDRKSASARTNKLLSTHCESARREPRSLDSPEKTLRLLADKYYCSGDGDWPEGLKPFLHEGDMLGLTPAEHCSLAIKALGGCVTYLTECLLDIQVLGMAQFTSYKPPDVPNEKMQDTVSKWEGGNTLVLDAITLRNLRIVQDEGCLYDKLNFCSTFMGKRLLYQWVCAPSCIPAVIKERQQAVKALFDNRALFQDAKNILTTLPDLERLLAKVHSIGNLMKSKDHPDSRAIFYEDETYSKRKVLDFIAVLNGFTAVLKLVEMFSECDSTLLKTLTQFGPEGKFPDYRGTLKFFKEGFKFAEAEKEGRILPGAGVDPEYDSILETVEQIQREIKQYLNEQEKFFRCRLAFVGSDKKRYQLEVPERAAERAGPQYQLEGARKGFKKFSTTKTREFLARMIAAEEKKCNVLKDLSRRIFERFSTHYEQWARAVRCVASLDVLLSLAEFAAQQNTDVCLPHITYDSNTKPYLKITEGRHPCIPIGSDFIPNDTCLGLNGPTLMLLTGPNMGGKSTLMRQLGLLTTLAHMGSYIPASECSLSVVDRIFTRLGAGDDIVSGQSTYIVEMSETASIVRHATVHSLVLLDELGRGTSTYDGTAIASGVCKELAERACRTVFATHYHTLVSHFANHPNVVASHMACMVETEENASDTEGQIPEETITFLYKLSAGACPKSYGFNAARLAGIPKEITRRAHYISREMEKEATCVRAFKSLFKQNNVNVRELLSGLTL